jgi:hypothetical protein
MQILCQGRTDAKSSILADDTAAATRRSAAEDDALKASRWRDSSVLRSRAVKPVLAPQLSWRLGPYPLMYNFAQTFVANASSIINTSVSFFPAAKTRQRFRTKAYFAAQRG